MDGGREMRFKSSSSLRGSVLSAFLLLLAASARAQQAPKTRTDPAEAAALNAVFSELGLTASTAWNISGDPCTGAATDGTMIDDNPNFNPGIKCDDCSDKDNTVCYITTLGFGSNNLSASLPSELGKLAQLEQLYIDSAGLNGPIPSSFSKLTNMKTLWASDNDFTGKLPDYIGSWTNLEELVLRNCRISDSLASVNFSQFTRLKFLDLSFNNITGQVPQALVNLSSLTFLFLGNNSLSGSLPSSIGHSLTNLDFSYNQLSGSFPSWVSPSLQLNLVANNFVINNSNNSVLPLGLECLQRNTPCFLGSPQSSSFAVDCGSSRPLSDSYNSLYKPDDVSLGPASYYVAEDRTWGVSNVGNFTDTNENYKIYSSRQFQHTPDSQLLQTARISPSSLRYYGVGLENGNYTVTLLFAEMDFEDSETWKSLGRREFDIYVQGERKEKNFDIRKEASGKSFSAVTKQYMVPVTRNFLEIHLFWAGKGTCCIPSQGYYGPAISALSVTPSHGFLAYFTPTAAPKKSKTSLIVGVVVGAAVLGQVVLAGLCLCRQKRRKLSLEQKELYSIVGRPNVFTCSELRTATEKFSSTNRLGEGGYGSVYKVWQLYEENHPLDVADPILTEFSRDEVLRAIRVGLLCIQSSPRQRPPCRGWCRCSPGTSRWPRWSRSPATSPSSR